MNFIISFILILLLAVTLYFLYVNGYMVTSVKRAVKFIAPFSGRKQYFKASFSFCDGYVKRVLKFRQSAAYQFVLQSALTKGYISMEITDKNKNRLLLLDSGHSSGEIKADVHKRYYLVSKFENASGRLEPSWYEKRS